MVRDSLCGRHYHQSQQKQLFSKKLNLLKIFLHQPLLFVPKICQWIASQYTYWNSVHHHANINYYFIYFSLSLGKFSQPLSHFFPPIDFVPLMENNEFFEIEIKGGMQQWSTVIYNWQIAHHIWLIMICNCAGLVLARSQVMLSD